MIQHLLVGTYTSRNEPREGTVQGIHCLRYDESGALTTESVVALADPSYVAYDAARGVLHAVVEQESGRVASAFLDPENGARELTDSASSGGADPCHLIVHPSGSHVFVANYSSGSVAVFPTGPDGRISTAEPSQLIVHEGSGPVADRQKSPHAHMVQLSPDGRFVLSADLGTDCVYVYAFDPATGTLAPHGTTRLPAGSGPRHLTFHGSGRHAYVLNELSSTIMTCAYDPQTGTLTPGPELSVRQNPTADIVDYPSAVRVSPDNRFVYAANRVEDTIVTFAIEDDGATLSLIGFTPCGGEWPRDIVLSPDGRLLFAANQTTNSITVFHIDTTTGALTSTGAPFTIPTPASVLPI